MIGDDAKKISLDEVQLMAFVTGSVRRSNLQLSSQTVFIFFFLLISQKVQTRRSGNIEKLILEMQETHECFLLTFLLVVM